MFYTLLIFVFGIFCGQEYTIPSIKVISLGVLNYTINYIQYKNEEFKNNDKESYVNKIIDKIFYYTGYSFKHFDKKQ